MFQFPGFALKTLCIQVISTWFTSLLITEVNNSKISSGLPHSEISGYRAYSRLPKAYRRVSRPSSPLTAKAFTKRPFRAWFDPEKDRLNCPPPAIGVSSEIKAYYFFPSQTRADLEHVCFNRLRLKRLVYLTWIVVCFWGRTSRISARKDQNPNKLLVVFHTSGSKPKATLTRVTSIKTDVCISLNDVKDC